MKKIKVGILKETKYPPDRRVPLTPHQGKELLDIFSNVELFIQSSDIRCYSDGEYRNVGLNVIDDISHCDILLGVKEVNIDTLLTNKTYLFFAHVGKKQPHNQKMLQEIVKKKIRLIDYEYLKNSNGKRMVAFGRWAGIVGAYNGLRALGLRSGKFNLIPAHECHDLNELRENLHEISLPNVKILITGGGRVAHGAIEMLEVLGVKEIQPRQFLSRSYSAPVFCQIDPWDYVKRKDGEPFDLQHFIDHPDYYESSFLPFTKVADLYISAHFWDPRSPAFMTQTQMQAGDFNIQVIADISCDLKIPIPSTIRASSVQEPFYGYDPFTGKETEPFKPGSTITVMAVDNLPAELPRDASIEFGNDLIHKVFPSLFGNDESGIIKRATITENGTLNPAFSYLTNYVEGK